MRVLFTNALNHCQELSISFHLCKYFQVNVVYMLNVKHDRKKKKNKKRTTTTTNMNVLNKYETKCRFVWSNKINWNKMSTWQRVNWTSISNNIRQSHLLRVKRVGFGACFPMQKPTNRIETYIISNIGNWFKTTNSTNVTRKPPIPLESSQGDSNEMD